MTYFLVAWLTFSCTTGFGFLGRNFITGTLFCEQEHHEKEVETEEEALEKIADLGQKRFPVLYRIHGSRVELVQIQWEPVIDD